MKHESDFDPLADYITNWKQLDGLKPSNEPIFIEWFIKLLENYPDDREVEFDGEGAYFGKQVTLKPFSFYGRTSGVLDFEIAYHPDLISVYTAHHHGFWNPEYIKMDKSHNDFSYLHSCLINFLKTVFGL